MNTTTGIYLRTSLTENDGAGQRHQLEQRAPAGARWFEDVGESGAKASRPALDELKRAIRSGDVRHVVVPAIDRLGRSLVDVVLLLDEWAQAGVSVHSLREGPIDPSTPMGRFFVQMLAAFAELERANIRERIGNGLARAKAKGTRSGKSIGRPRRTVDPREIARRRAAGESWRAIARALHCPEPTVRRAAARTASKPSP